MVEILYNKHKEVFGYYKISAIRAEGYSWGKKELGKDFGILKLDIKEEELRDWNKLKKYCVNESEDGITETPEKYKPVIENTEETLAYRKEIINYKKNNN